MPRNHKGWTVQRRQFLTCASATIATASIAGCSGILGGDGGGDSGPEAAVTAYINAGADADEEAISDSVHPDAPSAMAQAAALFSMANSVDIQSTEVVEQSDEEATVDVTYEVDAQGESQSTTTRYIVRTNEDGEWKVYSST